jgi:hypothetical protein
MDPLELKNQFNKRAFTALVLLLSGSLLPISGIMNHLVQFDSLTPDKHFWMSFHNIAALILCISAIAHISLNWLPLTRYAKKVNGILLNKEAV